VITFGKSQADNFNQMMTIAKSNSSLYKSGLGLCQIVNSEITEQVLTKNIRVYEFISAIKRLKIFVKEVIQTFS
jgi:hypothetical protein